MYWAEPLIFLTCNEFSGRCRHHYKEAELEPDMKAGIKGGTQFILLKWLFFLGMHHITASLYYHRVTISVLSPEDIDAQAGLHERRPSADGDGKGQIKKSRARRALRTMQTRKCLTSLTRRDLFGRQMTTTRRYFQYVVATTRDQWLCTRSQVSFHYIGAYKQ